jgi:hypothetical protein
MTVNEQLIGKKFKRVTKYGTSIFIGIITEVIVVFENYRNPFKHEIPHIKVKSENGIVYSLNEIVLV